MKKFIILILLVILTGCSKNEYILPEELIFKEKEVSINVYDTLNINDLYEETNADIIAPANKPDTTTIGTNTYTITLKYKKHTYKKDLTYKVIDNEAPTILSAPSTLTIKVNDDVYPCDNIVYIDNYDKEPSCQINGNYDLTKTGMYNVKYILTDSSNNETTKDLKLNIVDHISNKPQTPQKKNTLPIETVINNYKTDKTSIGIDVSRWQGNIDYEKVKNAGIEFVIMRIGVNSSVKKDVSIDSYYEQNIKKAKEAGLKVGVYLYTSAINNKMANEHAKWLIEILNGEKLDFPIAYDFENWQYIMEYKISKHDLDEALETFTMALKKANYDTMLYSSKFYLEKVWSNKNNIPVWLAHYTSVTSYKGNYFLWQMSNIGSVPGINNDVDINILYKEKMDLQ